VSDRGQPAEGAIACPFVAFADDRDARSDEPDHRHRCYAEVRPAPRALAHQAAYCLSPGFAACPTFQDWARREAARVTRGPRASDRSMAGVGTVPPPAGVSPPTSSPPAGPPSGTPAGAAVSSTGQVPGRGEPSSAPRDAAPSAPLPPFLAEREPAVDARGAWAPGGARSGHEALHPAGTPEPFAERDWLERAEELELAPHRAASGVPGRSQERGMPGARAAQRGVGRGERGGAPPWERPRRDEAYPTLRTRVGLPELPRLAVAAVALVVAAVALFFAGPMLLGVGEDGGTGSGPSPTPTVSPTPPPSPSPSPEPTPFVYVVRAGDTLSKIARQFGVTVDQIVAANRETIRDPDRISEGQQIVIPTPVPSEIEGRPSEEPSASP
jgi:hypothetical protein